MLTWLLVLQFLFGSALGQYGCGQQPFPEPAPILPPAPCTYVTTPTPPIVQPVPNCKGCPVHWQLPQLVPVPRVYPEIPPGKIRVF